MGARENLPGITEGVSQYYHTTAVLLLLLQVQ